MTELRKTDKGYTEWNLIKAWRERDTKILKERRRLNPYKNNPIEELKNYLVKDAEEYARKMNDLIDLHDLTEHQVQRVRNIIITNSNSMGCVHDLIKILEKANIEAQ